MTREERIEKLRHLITCMKCEVSGKSCDNNCPTQYNAGNMGEIIENLEEIAKALEQELCEDVISREEALKTIEKYADEYERRANRIDTANPEYPAYHAKKRWNGMALGLDKAKELLTDMPSVTPQPKTGHWIKTISENGITSAVRCSECGFEDNRYMLFRYCPNCGAKIAEREDGK